MSKIEIEKGELQKLQTLKNQALKCINQIEYRINHIKVGAYDYGESHEQVVADVKDLIADFRNKN